MITNSPHLSFPHQEWFCGNNAYFDLERVELLSEYEGKLIIDWGKSARMWHQKGTTEKEIVAIEAAHKQPFPGFENLILTYQELQDMVHNSTDYEAVQEAFTRAVASM